MIVRRDRRAVVDPDDAEAGFTLMELLVALMLLALIALLLMEALRGGGQALRVVERNFSQLELRQVRNYLEDALASAVPHVFVPEGGATASPFHGGRRSLTFITNHTVAGQYAGLYVTRLMLRPGADGHSDLWLDQYLFHRYSSKDHRVSPRVRLLRGVARLHFRYFGSLREGEPARWHDTWRNPRRPPDAVAFVVEFDKNDSRYWPVLVVSLRVMP